MATKNRAKLSRMTEDEARAFLEGIRWPNGPVCPHCGSRRVGRLEGKATRPGLFKCKEKGCRKQFTVTVGTIFQGSKIALRDWVYAFGRMCASKKGISALQLQRELECQYRTAWFLCHRIRHAMSAEPLRGMLQGTLEMDETYVGGKPRTPMTREEYWRSKGTVGEKSYNDSNRKVPLVALVERNGKIRTKAVCDVKPGSLRRAMLELVDGADPAAILNTDEHKAYLRIGKRFAAHKRVLHSAREYHRHSDDAGINTAESFFGLFKRGINGAFHHVSRRHLQRYADEFSFRWNHRDISDYDRTLIAIKGGDGRRLMYRHPTGHALCEPK